MGAILKHVLWLLLCQQTVARGSAGCGAREPFDPSTGPKRFSFKVEDSTQPTGQADRWYWVQLPKVYDKHTPASLVLSFHGFYDNAHDEIYEDSLPTVVDNTRRNVVTVYPVGSADIEWEHGEGERFGWNVDGNGLNRESGPLGPVCKLPRYMDGSGAKYTCYKSCKRSKAGCSAEFGCNSASCMEDGRFVRALIEHIENQVCIDLDRVHLTGISAGALMVYQLALDLAGTVASVAPVAGSRFLGFNHRPAAPVALLDIHGLADVYIPAEPYTRSVTRTENQTLKHPQRVITTTTTTTTTVSSGPMGSVVSEDDFFYTPLHDITQKFAAANGCEGGKRPHPTRWDGIRDFSCYRPHGACGRSALVQCSGDWGHTWPLSNTHPDAYAHLVLEFFEQHPRVQAGDVGLKASPSPSGSVEAGLS